MTTVPPVVLLSGDDESLLTDAVLAAVDAACEGAERGEVIHELRGEEYTVGDVVSSAATPPFLADRRVVVARGIGRFAAAELAPLVAEVSSLLPTTRLVLEWGSGRVNKALSDAVKAAGGVARSTVPAPTGKGRREWFDVQFDAAAVSVDGRAQKLIVEHLGQDVGRLRGLLDTLAAVHGEGARVGVAEVEPFLGDAGAVPPWELTDPMDQGDLSGSLSALRRMLDAGGQHPLQIMATLQRHYEQALRLDGAGASDEKGAAAILGISPFPAKKALTRSRRLGPEGIRAAIRLLAAADADLRGASGLDERAVLEVLVARLAQRSRR